MTAVFSAICQRTGDVSNLLIFSMVYMVGRYLLMVSYYLLLLSPNIPSLRVFCRSRYSSLRSLPIAPQYFRLINWRWLMWKWMLLMLVGHIIVLLSATGIGRMLLLNVFQQMLLVLYNTDCYTINYGMDSVTKFNTAPFNVILWLWHHQ